MKISIAEPCHENWDAMTPNKQGAFCNSCVKDVVDFSNKSIDEIKNFFSKPQTGKVCGRFEEKQLQELTFDDFFARFTYWNFSKKFAVIFFMAFGFWIFSNANAMAQSDKHKMKGEVMVMSEKKVKQNAVTDATHQEAEKRMIKGKIARNVTTCTSQTITPVDKLKGNVKTEPIQVVEEQRMLMGMVAYNPHREKDPIKEPVIAKDKLVKGDTIITNDALENKTADPEKQVTEELLNQKPETTILKTPLIKTGEVEKTIEPEKIISEAKILVYPNPNAGNFVIETSTKQILTILDENGKIVLSQAIDGTTNINASHLRAGIYYVNLVNGEARVTKKIVITK
jgi:hypothetical protein